MAQRRPPARRGEAVPAGAELMRAKMALVEARARGEPEALARVAARFPGARADLAPFSAALVATDGAPDEAPTAAVELIATRARQRAFTAVFATSGAAAPVPAVAVAPTLVTLKALRQARRLALTALAERLGLGVDVLSALEAGRIAATSVPDRLVRALGDVLDLATDAVRAALEGQPALVPALQRSRSGERRPEPEAAAALDFSAVVRLSPGMSAVEKDYWLDEA